MMSVPPLYRDTANLRPLCRQDGTPCTSIIGAGSWKPGCGLPQLLAHPCCGSHTPKSLRRSSRRRSRRRVVAHRGQCFHRACASSSRSATAAEQRRDSRGVDARSIHARTERRAAQEIQGLERLAIVGHAGGNEVRGNEGSGARSFPGRCPSISPPAWCASVWLPAFRRVQREVIVANEPCFSPFLASRLSVGRFGLRGCG